MKGLDTPVLLGLLRGEPRMTALLRKLSGEELCTTTVNLFELETIARSDPAPGRDRRLAAVEQLRRKLTILPIDERSAGLAAVERSKASVGSGGAAPSWLILGALLAGRCSEWITTAGASFPSSGELKVVVVDRSGPKKA
jgi:predicted nucleic acid-binding protein